VSRWGHRKLAVNRRQSGSGSQRNNPQILNERDCCFSNAPLFGSAVKGAKLFVLVACCFVSTTAMRAHASRRSIVDLRKLDFKPTGSKADSGGASVPAVYRFLARFQLYHQDFPQVAD